MPFSAAHSPVDDWIDIGAPTGRSRAVLENTFRRWVLATGGVLPAATWVLDEVEGPIPTGAPHPG